MKELIEKIETLEITINHTNDMHIISFNKTNEILKELEQRIKKLENPHLLVPFDTNINYN